jgi:hypothetical protein
MSYDYRPMDVWRLGRCTSHGLSIECIPNCCCSFTVVVEPYGVIVSCMYYICIVYVPPLCFNRLRTNPPVFHRQTFSIADSALYQRSDHSFADSVYRVRARSARIGVNAHTLHNTATRRRNDASRYSYRLRYLQKRGIRSLGTIVRETMGCALSVHANTPTREQDRVKRGLLRNRNMERSS